MGIIKKQAFHNTAISYLGAILGYVNFLILLPYAFLPEQIGLVRVLQNASLLFVPLAQLGIIAAVLRYFPFFKDDSKKRHSFFFYSVAMSIIGFLFFLSLFFIFENHIINLYQDESPMVLNFYRLILPLTLFLLFFGVLEAFTNSHFKTALPIFLRDIVLRLFTTILAVCYIGELIDFNGFIWGLISAYAVNLLILALYLLKIGELKFSFTLSFLNKGLLKEILTFSLFAVLTATGALFISYIDILMIGAMIGLAPTGIYATAYFMAVVIDIPRRSIKQIVDPFLSVAIKNDDHHTIDELYKKVSINQLLIGFLLVLGIWLNIDDIFKLMPNGNIYAQGKYVVLIIMIAKLIDMATSINGEIIGYSKHYRFNLISLAVLALLAVVTNYLLIPSYGINGAAIATLISLILFNLIKYLFVFIRMKYQPFTGKTILLLLITVITYLIISYIPAKTSPILNMLVKSILIILIYGLSIYYFKISYDFNVTVKNIFRRYLSR